MDVDYCRALKLSLSHLRWPSELAFEELVTVSKHYLKAWLGRNRNDEAEEVAKGAIGKAFRDCSSDYKDLREEFQQNSGRSRLRSVKLGSKQTTLSKSRNSPCNGRGLLRRRTSIWKLWKSSYPGYRATEHQAKRYFDSCMSDASIGR